VAGDEHPRQRDVFELAQVAEILVNGQAALAGPTQRLGQLALADPHPRLQRRYGTHVGGGTPDLQALRLVEQVERAVEVCPSLLDPCHGRVPAVPVLRYPAVLAQLLASLQVATGAFQIALLTAQLAQPYVQIRR
jgi:hypothetical protein